MALSGCSADDLGQPVGPRLAIRTAPLDLLGVDRACYDLRVETLGPPAALVIARGDPALSLLGGDDTTLCSDRFGNGPGGAIAYVTPCDASSPPHAVTLWVDGLYADTGQGLAPLDYQDPCPAGCSLEAICRENADTPVEFNLTIMRPASQGFFDLAVNFNAIFCAAKADCEYAPDNPIEMLQDPETGARGPTLVLGFACLGPAGAEPLELFRDPITFACPDDTWIIDPIVPHLGEGNLYSHASGPNPAPAGSPIWQVATFFGSETAPCGAGPAQCQHTYWNVAIGYDPSVPDCHLSTLMSASGDGSFDAFSTPVGSTWPLIAVDLPVTGPLGRACTRHPLNGTPEGVATTYTSLDAPHIFSFAFDGEVTSANLPPAGPFAGNGADGPITVEGLTLLTEEPVATGRTQPDAVAYPVASLGPQSITTASVPLGFAPGDELLLINVYGLTAAHDAVGRYTFARVASVSGDTLTLAEPIDLTLGQTDNDDLSGQTIIAQRVPNYSDVHIMDGGTLSAHPFDGQTGGIVAFRVSGTLSVATGGTIHADALGYAGGALGPVARDAFQGHSYAGVPIGGGQYNNQNGAFVPNFGGGGAHITGGGGEHAGGATPGDRWDGANAAPPQAGLVYGTPSLDTILFGSGGGGVYNRHNNPGPGGRGGGIVFIGAATVSLASSGAISARGETTPHWSTGSWSYGAGGGAGGSILLRVAALTAPPEGLSAEGGLGWQLSVRRGGNGGAGRVRVDFGALNGELWGSPAAAAALPDLSLPPPGWTEDPL